MNLPVVSPVLPMLAKPVPSIPLGEGLVYEPKWDGFRCIAYRDRDAVRLDSRSAKPMTRYFPDIVAAALAALPERCVVDGEIVVAIDGRLDFEALGQRIHPAASRVALLAERTPAALVVFDVLAWGDRDLTGARLEQRLAVLDDFALTGPLVHATPRTKDPAEAQRWFEDFEGAGLDGVMVKSLDSMYQPNKRVMFKVKHARTADVVLAGYRLHKTSTPERPLLGSMLLGLYADGALRFVGAATSFPAKRRAELVTEVAPLVAHGDEEHPWDDGGIAQVPGATSRWSGGRDMSFTRLRPERVLEVAYDHMEGSRFRHTVQFVRWRTDRDPESCTFDQLDEPVGYDLSALLPGVPGSA